MSYVPNYYIYLRNLKNVRFCIRNQTINEIAIFHCTVDILIFIFMTKSENKGKQTDHALNFFSSVLLFFKQRGKLLGRCLFYVIFSLFEQCLCSINKFCKFSVSKRAWLLLGDNWKNWNGLKVQLYGQQLQKNSLCSVFLICFYGWKNGNT